MFRDRNEIAFGRAGRGGGGVRGHPVRRDYALVEMYLDHINYCEISPFQRVNDKDKAVQ
jgi:hypothetical protein